MEQPPKHLYKYISWENPCHRRIITHGEMFFASARRFNDPFDCRIRVRYDLASDSFKVSWLTSTLHGTGGIKSEKEAKEAAESVVRKGPIEFEKWQNIIDTGLREGIIDSFGIWCASEVDDSIPMWAHYANCHQGLCIVYNAAVIDRVLMDHYQRTGDLVTIYKVEYVEKYPEVIRDQVSGPEMAKAVLSHKAAPWSYEREWRVVVVRKTNIAIPMPPNAIHQILFGLKAPQSTIVDVSEGLERIGCDAQLLQAREKKGTFALEFHPTV